VVSSLPLVYSRCFKNSELFLMAKTSVFNNHTPRGTNLDVNDVVSLDSPSSEF
jgi:hypothetical protein